MLHVIKNECALFTRVKEDEIRKTMKFGRTVNIERTYGLFALSCLFVSLYINNKVHAFQQHVTYNSRRIRNPYNRLLSDPIVRIYGWFVKKQTCQQDQYSQWLKPRPCSQLSSVSTSRASDESISTANSIVKDGAIAMNLQELSSVLGGGIGRAQLVWDCYKLGIDPDEYYTYKSRHVTVDIPIDSNTTNIDDDNEFYNSIQKQLPSMRRTQMLGSDSLRKLSNTYQRYDSSKLVVGDNWHRRYRLQGDVATLVHVSVSDNTTTNVNDNENNGQHIDLTTKLLIRMSSDGLLVETVIIPSWKNGQHRSTVCISSQVGCKQGCQFCATGKMGKIRSLTASEILVQMFYAQQVVRKQQYLYERNQKMNQSNKITTDIGTNNDGTEDRHTHRHWLPPITNVVFMGMGEPADNADAVKVAVDILTDRTLYQLSANRVTVSTVAPTPKSFELFENTTCVLAWSVHAVRDDLRKLLVPTTKYPMTELRDGFIRTLNRRKYKTTMIEVVLIDNINDHVQEAIELAEFCHGIINSVPGCKLFVNLIPYNEISIPNPGSVTVSTSSTGFFSLFRKPSIERIRSFQEQLWKLGIYAPVRTPRGDDESAACGQLVTNNNNKNRIKETM